VNNLFINYDHSTILGCWIVEGASGYGAAYVHKTNGMIYTSCEEYYFYGFGGPWT
jgi:hypothetical protein